MEPLRQYVPGRFGGTKTNISYSIYRGDLKARPLVDGCICVNIRYNCLETCWCCRKKLNSISNLVIYVVVTANPKTHHPSETSLVYKTKCPGHSVPKCKGIFNLFTCRRQNVEHHKQETDEIYIYFNVSK